MDEAKGKVKNVIKNNVLFFIGCIMLIYKGLFINMQLKMPIENIEIVWYIVAVALLLMSPIINKKNKFSYIYLNIIYFIITLIIYADFLYYSYSTNFISFYQIENIKYAKEIGSGILGIIDLKSIILFWFDNIAILILSIIAYKKTKFNNNI